MPTVYAVKCRIMLECIGINTLSTNYTVFYTNRIYVVKLHFLIGRWAHQKLKKYCASKHQLVPSLRLC
jgi:hypothetical protein